MGEPDYSPDRVCRRPNRLHVSTGAARVAQGQGWPGPSSCTRRDRCATVDVQDDLRPPWGCVLWPRMRTAAGWLVPLGLRTESGA